jgi:hypothetical protein
VAAVPGRSDRLVAWYDATLGFGVSIKMVFATAGVSGIEKGD